MNKLTQAELVRLRLVEVQLTQYRKSNWEWGVIQDAVDLLKEAEQELETRMKASVSDTAIPAPNQMECKHCGYVGYAYGIPHDDGVSAPFCQKCGKNDGLKIASSDRTPVKTGTDSETAEAGRYALFVPVPDKVFMDKEE